GTQLPMVVPQPGTQLPMVVPQPGTQLPMVVPQPGTQLPMVVPQPGTQLPMVVPQPGTQLPAVFQPFDYGALINKGGDTNPSTALAPVAPFGSYEIVPYRNDAGSNPLDTAQNSAVAEAVSDAGGPLALPGPTTRPLALPGPTMGQLALPAPGQSTMQSRRVDAEQRLLDAAMGINNRVVDPLTGIGVGRLIADDRGNILIEPIGGRTIAAGRNGVDTHTLYPNDSNYQRYNPVGHGMNTTPHGHGHLMGTGGGRRGQGASLDVYGNTVPFDSADAHWPIH
ncbi:MAG: hypothetical protein IKK33_16970, partial [Lachnospiraceae bacterium]|nr:hypothetical protein [Lachnospiraceae bacterium]